MFLGILVLITALTISAVAIYYSVAGLVAIFAAAAVPIMIMGSVLEIGKLVTAVWLHRYWQEATWWLKTYLTLAVVVLMFITSMGIFGFLSRAHIEQTANAREGIAQIERNETEIQRQNAIVERARAEITNIQSAGVSQDNTVQEQIDREQQRIETAYSRIQPAIDEQLKAISREETQISQRIVVFESQLDQLNQRLLDLDAALNANDVRRAQSIVGARQDGALGPNTSAAIQGFRDAEETRRTELLERTDQIRIAPNSTIQNARDEVARLRNLAEQQIQESNTLINRLRSQLGTVDIQAINQQIGEQENTIAQANSTIDTLTEQKYSLEIEYRKLEAEVGPVKYLAEFIYGEAADQDILEEAVRWVIMIIIFVFDPLAVLLLIASQHTFELRRKQLPVVNTEQPKKERLRLKRQKHKAEKKAQHIVNTTDIEVIVDDSELVEKKENIIDITIRSNDDRGNRSESDSNGDRDETNNQLRPAINSRAVETEDTVFGAGYEGGSLSDGMESETRLTQLEETENDANWSQAKRRWKDENPEQTVKFYKQLYIQGKIDKLPWEQYLTSEYVQNEEQSENRIWNKIKNNE